jgi:nicotinamide-nucleotide amidase
MIASAITDVPGASKCFKGSVVSYANEWKSKLLQVSDETLKNYGAVSRECVTEMLKVAELYNTDATAAVTGIAGPGGGTEHKPVGTVFIAVKYKDIIESEKFLFSGSRESIRLKARNTAFNMLINIILINHREQEEMINDIDNK